MAVAAAGASVALAAGVCWCLCAKDDDVRETRPGGAGRTGSNGADEFERLRRDVEKAERALRSEVVPPQPDTSKGTAEIPSGTLQYDPRRKDAPPAPDGDWLSRTRLLVGDDSLARLARMHVLVVGLGGVGGNATEWLVRGGIGHITIVDGDVVDPTNRNRQLIALRSTQEEPKAHALAKRLLDINPQLDCRPRQEYLQPDPAALDALLQSAPFDYVVDCIDSLQPKVELIRSALKHRVPVVSTMGAGGRLDPSQVITCDLSELRWERQAKKAQNEGTAGQNTGPVAHDKLGAFVRKKLKKEYGIEGGITVVTSTELPAKAFALTPDKSNNKASFYGTCSYMPAAFGMHASSTVLRALGSDKPQSKQARKLRQAAEYAAAQH
jgi:tRNA A37 threonylcarbamoyladenosine dehydratase